MACRMLARRLFSCYVKVCSFRGFTLGGLQFNVWNWCDWKMRVCKGKCLEHPSWLAFPLGPCYQVLSCCRRSGDKVNEVHRFGSIKALNTTSFVVKNHGCKELVKANIERARQMTALSLRKTQFSSVHEIRTSFEMLFLWKTQVWENQMMFNSHTCYTKAQLRMTTPKRLRSCCDFSTGSGSVGRFGRFQYQDDHMKLPYEVDSFRHIKWWQPCICICQAQHWEFRLRVLAVRWIVDRSIWRCLMWCLLLWYGIVCLAPTCFSWSLEGKKKWHLFEAVFVTKVNGMEVFFFGGLICLT